MRRNLNEPDHNTRRRSVPRTDGVCLRTDRTCRRIRKCARRRINQHTRPRIVQRGDLRGAAGFRL